MHEKGLTSIFPIVGAFPCIYKHQIEVACYNITEQYSFLIVKS